MAGKIARGMWAYVWLIGWLVSWAGYLYAQDRPTQFEFQHIQEKDGLSFNLVNCFHQDRDGFLWVGTYRGLNRYDGDRFTIFRHNDTEPYSLLHNTIYDLCEDQRGNIWIAVENGIGCYEKATGRFRNIGSVDGSPLRPCQNILCDRNGDIWFTSDGLGLFRHRPAQNVTERFYGFRKGVIADEVNWVLKNGLLLDPNENRLWLSTEDGIAYFDINRCQFYNYLHNPQRVPILFNRYCSALALDGNQLLFADNENKEIIRYSLGERRVLGTIRPVSQQPGRSVFPAATIFIDRQHNIWVSSATYVSFHIAARTHQVTELTHEETSPTSIASSFFWTAWQHPDGAVWLGTVNGISQTNPDRAFYSVYNVARWFPPLTDEGGITSIHEDNDGSWWLGTHVRGVLHYHPKTNQLNVFRLPDEPDKLPYGGFVAAIVPYEDDLYIGANIGFSRINKRAGTVEKIPLPTGWQRSTSLKDAILYNRLIWISDDKGEIFSYSPQTRQWQQYPVQALSDKSRIQVREFLINRHNELWAHVLPEGFARFDAQKRQFVVEKPAANSGHSYNAALVTRAGSFDRDGNIWMAANGFGLWRYNTATRTYDNWTENNGLAYDRAHNALTDDLGNVWVASYNQFTVFNPSRNRFTRFKLPINEANILYFNALCRLRNGHVVTALKGHLVEFFPEKLVRQKSPPPSNVLISQVSNGDSTWLNYNGSRMFELQPGESGFSVHFSALTSASEAPLQFMYQLEGYEDWRTAGEARYAVYTKVPGGLYTFRVKAITADGRETPVSTLPIRINVYFYQTFWFWGIMGVIALGLLIGFLRYRADQIHRLHDLQVQATRLERDKTEIQYQNLINHLNPHFLFNSLTSLNSLITINPRQASTFLSKLSIIYRYILQSKDKELVPLEKELAFVEHYIALQKSRFEDALQTRIDIGPDYLSRLIVPVTLQNLLENAIKHNTLDEEEPLVISIYPEGDYLCVVNNLQKKTFVETSNKQGLASLKSMYHYLSRREIDVIETETQFIVKVPLL